MGSDTHTPGEETFLPRHALPKKVGYHDSATGLVRSVSEAYPLPTSSNPANLTAGDVEGWSVVHKFGHNQAVGTTYAPITYGSLYPTPQVSAATALRVKAGNAADTADGAGARKVMLYGIDETGAEVSEELTTAGASASSPTSATFLRLFRAFVSESGTYASASAGSHAAAITIENAAGTEDWATIALEGFPRGQSYIGAYTVPLGKTAYLMSAHASTDSTKVTDLILFFRPNILQTSAPYSAMRAQRDVHVGPRGFADILLDAPMGPYAALTDIGFMGKVDSGTAEVDVNFEIWLKDE